MLILQAYTTMPSWFEDFYDKINNFTHTHTLFSYIHIKNEEIRPMGLGDIFKATFLVNDNVFPVM